MSTHSKPTITLVEEGEGWWTVYDDVTGIASQGPDREAALVNLDEAVAATGRATQSGTLAPVPDAPWFEGE